MSPRFLPLFLLLGACGPVRAKVDVEDQSAKLKSGFFNDASGSILIHFSNIDGWCDVYAGREPRGTESVWDLSLLAQPISSASTTGDYESAPESVAILEPGTFTGELSYEEPNGTTRWDVLNGVLTVDEHETGVALSGSLDAEAWRDVNESGDSTSQGTVSATFDLEFCEL